MGEAKIIVDGREIYQLNEQSVASILCNVPGPA